MSIIRKVQRTSYTVVDNGALNDTRLSWKSTGLLAYLLSLPDGWRINYRDLSRRKRDGKDSTLAAMRELVDAGYVERRQENDGKGRLTWVTMVYEEPVGSTLEMAGSPRAGLPRTVLPRADNPPLVSTKEVSTDEVKTEEPKPSRKKKRRVHSYTEEFERFWALYPVRENKPKAAEAFEAALERASFEEIAAGVERYKALLAADSTRKPKFAQGWLNDDRWLDEAAPTEMDRAIAMLRERRSESA